MKIDRRFFISLIGAIGASLGFFRSGHSLGVFLKGPEKEVKPRIADNLFVQNGKSFVAAVGGNDLDAMIRKAVDLIGGFDALGFKGRTVLVKPNVVGGKGNATTTNAAVVGAVVRVLREEGASKIYVGDMSALIRGSTKRNMGATGIMRAAKDAGAETLFFEDHEWFKVRVPGNFVEEVEVSEWIFRVDRVINLPVIKTHRYAGHSICLKNFVGATHFAQRPYFVDRGHWAEVVAELNLAYRPDLNIVDGTTIMVEGGPWEGKTEETNLILASGDRIACDVIGLGIIRTFGKWDQLERGIWEQAQIRRAIELGLGAHSKEDMEIVTASLDGNPKFSELIEKAKGYL